MNFEIKAHIGIGPVKLGMSQKDVKIALGKAAYCGSRKNSEYYFSNSFQIEFREGKADFIGVSHSNEYTVLYHDKNVFDMVAQDLFSLFASNESKEHSYDSYEYLFPDQIVSLWDADKQYDPTGCESRVVWAQVGVGSKYYYEAVK